MHEAALVAVEERFNDFETELAVIRNKTESLPHTIKTRHFEQVLLYWEKSLILSQDMIWLGL